VVDEAHCVSQCATTSAPTLRIPRPGPALHRPPLWAFTATPPGGAGGIVLRLVAAGPPSASTGFDRPNLSFGWSVPDQEAFLRDFLDPGAAVSGSVYCATRKAVEEVCAFLRAREWGGELPRGAGGRGRERTRRPFVLDRTR
jgi:ATP-dependent DNA helicase RecQ